MSVVRKASSRFPVISCYYYYYYYLFFLFCCSVRLLSSEDDTLYSIITKIIRIKKRRIFLIPRIFYPHVVTYYLYCIFNFKFMFGNN